MGKMYSVNTRLPTREFETKKFIYPRIFHKTFWSQLLQRYLTIKVTEHGLNHIQAAGGIDKYILGTDPKEVWSLFGEELRFEMADVIKKYENEVWLRALNDDEQCLEYAYSMVTREEHNESLKGFLNNRRREWKHNFPLSMRQQFFLQHTSNEVEKYLKYMHDEEEQNKYNPLLMADPGPEMLKPDVKWMRVVS